MAENYDKIAKLVKANNEIKQSEVATKLGVSIGQVSMMDFCRAQVEAGAYTKAPGTAASVKKLRDSESNRWELIAARTGLSVSAVKTKYEEAGGDPTTSSTGRGRPVGGSTRKSGGTSAGRKSGAAGRKTKATAKKAGSKKATGKKAGARIVRNRTGRRSVAGNPS